MFGKKVTIATHNGKFHADDVFAVATLSLVYKGKIKVIRTREASIIVGADIVLDVGLIYDADKNRFDHHQTEGSGERENGVPYAAFGLIWKHFGMKLCSTEKVFTKIDEKLVQTIDASDVGLSTYTLQSDEYSTVAEPGTLIEVFNPTLDENDDPDEIFMELVDVAKKVLERFIAKAEYAQKAAQFVEEAYANAEDKRLIVFDKPYPWKEVLMNYDEPLAVVFQDTRSNVWYVQMVPKDTVSFENRISLPEEWGGLVDEELQKATGVADAKFCHRKLFLAGAESKEGALALAHKALEN